MSSKKETDFKPVVRRRQEQARSARERPLAKSSGRVLDWGAEQSTRESYRSKRPLPSDTPEDFAIVYEEDDDSLLAGTVSDTSFEGSSSFGSLSSPEDYRKLGKEEVSSPPTKRALLNRERPSPWYMTRKESRDTSLFPSESKGKPSFGTVTLINYSPDEVSAKESTRETTPEPEFIRAPPATPTAKRFIRSRRAPLRVQERTQKTIVLEHELELTSRTVEEDGKTKQQWKLMSSFPVGDGISGTVFKAEGADGKTYAIKHGVIGPDEIHFMDLAAGYGLTMPSVADWYTKSAHLVIMEFLPYTLKSAVDESVDPSDSWEVVKKIIMLVFNLHQFVRAAHRDIKSDNIMLDEERNCFLVDFGITRKIYEDPDRAWFDIHWVADDYSHIQSRTNLLLFTYSGTILKHIGLEIARVSQVEKISLAESEARVVLSLMTASRKKLKEISDRLETISVNMYEPYKTAAKEKFKEEYKDNAKMKGVSP